MGATDTGKVRQQNQDAFICRRVGENTGYAIVCDGMGGEKAGEVASATACQLIDKFCLLYTSPSPRDRQKSRMPSSA